MGRPMPLKALVQSACGNAYYHWNPGTVPRAVLRPAEAVPYYLFLEIADQCRALERYRTTYDTYRLRELTHGAMPMDVHG